MVARARPRGAHRPSRSFRAASAGRGSRDRRRVVVGWPKVKIRRRPGVKIGRDERHHGTLRALGLGRIGQPPSTRKSRTLPACSARSRHFVKVEEQSRGRQAQSLEPEAGAGAQGPQARRPRPRLRQGPLLRPRDQGPEVALGLAQDARRLRGRPDADRHALGKLRGNTRRTRCRSGRSALYAAGQRRDLDALRRRRRGDARDPKSRPA